MDDIIDNFGYISISENNELLTYINTLDIDYNLKNYLYDLIENDKSYRLFNYIQYMYGK